MRTPTHVRSKSSTEPENITTSYTAYTTSVQKITNKLEKGKQMKLIRYDTIMIHTSHIHTRENIIRKRKKNLFDVMRRIQQAATHDTTHHIGNEWRQI